MLIRMPPGMRERIAEASTQSGRSMNAEVIARLEASFAEVQAPFTEAQEEAVRQMMLDHLEDVRLDTERRLKDLEERYAGWMPPDDTPR
ncbi:Arc family DNA-binding protein [Sphingomonas aquatilis]|nr:Arc family DNA-binding protein [Sphingomonas aquatilis]